MSKTPSNIADAQLASSPAFNGRNGKPKPAPISNGTAGSIVIVCVDPGLAQQMRKVVIPAACNVHEGPQLKGFVGHRQAVVAYCGPGSRAAAETTATYLQSKCYPDRVGTLDLTEAMGFDGDPEGFLPWWEEAMGMGHFEHGPDFLHQAEKRAKWRQQSPIIADDEDVGGDIKDPIGEVDLAAFHGPLGKLTLLTQPETEASALAVLLHSLVIFGAAVGRNPHFVISAKRHHMNLFMGVVGMTGLGRKGTAYDVGKAILSKVDPTFVKENIKDGLNSGAGLLLSLRDATTRLVKGSQVHDPGVIDKRRAYVEEELAGVLKSGHRESEVLLEVLRKLWDGADVIHSSTKDPVRVTEAHVSLIGHCTPEDLALHLSEADRLNGTANRILWFFVRRSKSIPGGGDVFRLLDDTTELEVQAQLDSLKEAIEVARNAERITRSIEVEKRWKALYARFDDIPPGRLGAFFVRAPIQIMRIASHYALADRVTVIEEPHLDAALALWRQSERALRYVFQADVDVNGEKLLAALEKAPEGITRNQIRDVFNRNKSAEFLDALLLGLLACGRILYKPPTPGRPGRPAPTYHLNRWS